METPPRNGYLPRKTFFWILGVFIMLVVTVLGYQIGKIDKLGETFNHNFTTVREDISEINVSVGRVETDLKLLRESLK